MIMKDKILKRLDELSTEIEAHLENRENYISELRKLDLRIKELSVLIPELRTLLDSEES